MNLLITVDKSVIDNQWWKDLLRIYAKNGEYFEIHCWSDESKEIKLAAEFGELASYNLPDMSIVHGTVTERFVAHLMHSDKPIDCQCYNKMVPFYTIRMGNHFISEKYGTEIIMKTRTRSEEEQIKKILSRLGSNITVDNTN